MKTTEDREIDGIKWTVTQFPATEGFKILVKVTKIIGPLIATTVGKTESLSSLMDMDTKNLNLDGAITLLLDSLTESETNIFIKRLMAHTIVNGVSVVDTFDITFQGKYATLFKVLKFIMEVNYKDFLDEIGLSEILKSKQTPLQAVSTN